MHRRIFIHALGQIRITSPSKKLIRSGTAVVLLESILPDRGEKIYIGQGEKYAEY